MNVFFKNHLKNVGGKTISRKILVFSVDDYGNVRLNSKADRDFLIDFGLKPKTRFDLFDSLESRQDLEELYEVLNSVRDKNNNPGIFTPFAVCANINFEKLIATDYENLEIEPLDITYSKLSLLMPDSYRGAWDLWKYGINEGFIRPQYHGREHFNWVFLKSELEKNNSVLKKVLSRKSYSFQDDTNYPHISYTATFDFSSKNELKNLKEIAIDGINRFENLYGYRPIHFMAPTSKVHGEILQSISSEGVSFVDQARVQIQHQGDGVYNKVRNFTGKINQYGQTILVRNIVFEPNINVKALEDAKKQITAAFRMGKPAIVSSHRVNFSGHIDESNRRKSLTSLKSLLIWAVKKYPDIEFMGSDDLCKIIANS